MAEYREILRVPKLACAWVKKNFICNLQRLPDSFTLGTGHVKFFYDKLAYIESRYDELFFELDKRKYKVEKYDLFTGLDDEVFDLYFDYDETANDRYIVSQRILLRLETTTGRSTFNKKPITPEEWYEMVSSHPDHVKQNSILNNYIQKAAL